MRCLPIALSCGAALLLAASAPGAAPQEAGERFHWPSFRGPAAPASPTGRNPPTVWNAETGHNILWGTEIPGLGHSSPIVWGDRIFLTTAVSDDPDPVFRYGTDGRIDRRSDRASNVWFAYAIDRRDGKVLWAREAARGAPEIQRHPKNSYASATPATDGEHVVVLVATGDLSAYDFDGSLRWEVDLGTAGLRRFLRRHLPVGRREFPDPLAEPCDRARRPAGRLVPRRFRSRNRRGGLAHPPATSSRRFRRRPSTPPPGGPSWSRTAPA